MDPSHAPRRLTTPAAKQRAIRLPAYGMPQHQLGLLEGLGRLYFAKATPSRSLRGDTFEKIPQVAGDIDSVAMADPNSCWTLIWRSHTGESQLLLRPRLSSVFLANSDGEVSKWTVRLALTRFVTRFTELTTISRSGLESTHLGCSSRPRFSPLQIHLGK